jgi:hypothetical protein
LDRAALLSPDPFGETDRAVPKKRGAYAIDGSIDYDEIKNAPDVVRVLIDHKPVTHLSRQVYLESR